MWKKVYFAALFLRFYWVFLPLTGYIHPDEFFQGPEKLAGDLFNYDVHTAWEFDESFPIRSPSIWYLLFGYPFWMARILRSTGAIRNIDSYWLVVAPRFMMAFLSFLTDNAIMKIAGMLGCSSYMAGCLSATSYVTVVFYTRPFSNSVEACLFAMVLLFVCEYVHLCKLGSSARSQPSNESGKVPLSSSQPSDNGVNASSSDTPLEKESHSESEDKFDAADGVEDTSMDSPGVKTRMGQLMDKHALISNGESATSNETEEDTSAGVSTASADVWQQDRYKVSIIITVLMVAGVWNRPTFIGYALVPLLYWLFQGKRPRTVRDVLMAIMRGMFSLPYVVNTSLIFILFDTSYYRSKGASTDYSILHQFVLTPLNFIVYNQNSANLAQHGLHPRYLHFAVNAPLLFGPLVAFLVIFIYILFFIHNKDHRSILVMLFLALVTPLALLSLFPHQEARFIIPILAPSIIITCYSLHLIESKTLYTIFFLFWIPHNLILGLLFGSVHQGGVIPSLLHLQRLKTEGAFNGGATIIYHRTYMPPKSLLQLYKQESKYLKLIDLQTKVDDLDLSDELMQYDTFLLVTPYHYNKLRVILQDKFSLEEMYSFYPHLSMEDPPDLENLFVYDADGFADWEEMYEAAHKYLTLNIYKVTNKKLIVQTVPSSGDCKNMRHNIDNGAYETMAITLPKAQILSM